MRETPDQAVALMVARAMMPLRIGPMHGVQPAAKTTPITPARKGDRASLRHGGAGQAVERADTQDPRHVQAHED